MKNVLITGASRGIGAAISEKFAQGGYNLSLCCHNSSDELMSLSEQLMSKYGITVLTHIGDVAEHEFVKNMVSATIDALGSIDILINNAGISYVGLLTDMDIDCWNKVISTNLTSVFSTCRYVIPDMLTRKKGKIINISSVWGNVGASCEVAYSASKGGINSMTRALGKELAPSNIQVNAIACGVINTDMNSCFTAEDKEALSRDIPAGRFGKPSEVAELAYDLCRGNSYLTGQIITLDGGWI